MSARKTAASTIPFAQAVNLEANRVNAQAEPAVDQTRAMALHLQASAAKATGKAPRKKAVSLDAAFFIER